MSSQPPQPGPPQGGAGSSRPTNSSQPPKAKPAAPVAGQGGVPKAIPVAGSIDPQETVRHPPTATVRVVPAKPNQASEPAAPPPGKPKAAAPAPPAPAKGAATSPPTAAPNPFDFTTTKRKPAEAHAHGAKDPARRDEHPPHPRVRKRKSDTQIMLFLLGGVLVIGLGVGAFALLRPKPKLAFRPYSVQELDEGGEIKVETVLDLEHVDRQKIRFGFIAPPPPGVQIDAATGMVSWKTGESDGPGEYQLQVSAHETDGPQSVGLLTIKVKEVNQPPTLEAIKPLSLRPGQKEIVFPLKALDPDQPKQKLTYALVSGPEGASVDASTGQFRCPASPALATPQECEVSVHDDVEPDKVATVKFTVEVPKGAAVMALLVKLKAAGLLVQQGGPLKDDHFQRDCYLAHLGEDELRVYECASVEEAEGLAGSVSQEGDKIGDREQHWPVTARLYRRENMLAVYLGDDEKAITALAGLFGEPFAKARAVAAPESLGDLIAGDEAMPEGDEKPDEEMSKEEMDEPKDDGGPRPLNIDDDEMSDDEMPEGQASDEMDDEEEKPDDKPPAKGGKKPAKGKGGKKK